jgi:hypothetical protein
MHVGLDPAPIDAETLRQLIDEKYNNVSVEEKVIDGERVLLGSGSAVGFMYIKVQALSATASHFGYYAQFITPDPKKLADAETVLGSIRLTFRSPPFFPHD